MSGRLLAAAGVGVVVAAAALWAWLSRGPELATLRGHRGVVRAVAVSPDGRLLATAGADGAVFLWGAGDYRLRSALRGHSKPVHAVAFAPGGDRLASAGADGVVKLWDVGSGQETASLPVSRRALDAVAFAPRDGALAAAGADGKIHLWETSSNQLLRQLPGHGRVHALSFGPDGRLASAGHDATVRLWDWSTGKQTASLPCPNSHTSALAHSPDGATLASAATAVGVRRWRVGPRQELPALPGAEAGLASDVAFSPDGRLLATAHEDGKVRVWDAAEGNVLVTYRGHRGAALGAAFVDDKRLLTCGGDGSAKVWPVPAH